MYGVNEFISVGVPSGGKGDYGILKLDRSVVGYKPYSKINQNIQKGDALTLIGHPVGLPKKTDKGGEVTLAGPLIIRGTVDSFGGNSGSPVFDANGLLVGILVGGSQDFDNNKGCDVSNICPGGEDCESLGEYIVPICVPILASEEIQQQIGISCEIEEYGENGFDVFTYSIQITNSASSFQFTILSFILYLLFIC